MRAARVRRLPSWLVGLLAVAAVAVVGVIAFASLLSIDLPWSGGYEVKAVFRDSQNIRETAPVRIAGVDVGEVVEVTSLAEAEDRLTGSGNGGGSDPAGEAASVVTMRLTDEARPVKEDATFRLEPRLFLEGNLLVDLRPGSPGAPEADSGHVFSVNQTSASVQLDQILTGSLQSDARRELQVLLREFGTALVDAGGSTGFRRLYETSPGAYKSTAQVSEALLGTEPRDLSGLVANLDQVIRGLDRDEAALTELVTNLRIFTGSFAAEDVALRDAVEELPRTLTAARPALDGLNATFPPLRAFAREALPGVRSGTPAVRDAVPFARQLRLLSEPAELRGLAEELERGTPSLTRLTQRTVPFLEQARAVSSCFNQVVIPWSLDQVSSTDPDYPYDAVGRVFEETGYGLTGIGGESRSGDANGQYIRVGAGGGLNTVETTTELGELLAGVTQFPLLGAMPSLSDSAKTRFRPDAPCENQEPPNLAAAGGAPPPQTTVRGEDAANPGGPVERILKRAKPILKRAVRASELTDDGRERRAERLLQRVGREFQRFREESP